jgi:hypothetical protein
VVPIRRRARRLFHVSLLRFCGKEGQNSGRGLIFCLPRRGGVRFKLTVVVPPDIDGLPPAELKRSVLKLLEENAEQTPVIVGATRGGCAAVTCPWNFGPGIM